MFSLKVVDSDAFLDMGQTAQLLYFHLSMRADDDGFIGNPKKIMRMVGSSDDDMKVLMGKRFVLGFESGIIVIKHWKMHNYIQSDRYLPSQYVEEKKLLITKENGSYTECIQNVSSLGPQVRIGKVRLELGKDRLGYTGVFEEFWKEYPDRVAKGKAYDSWNKLSSDTHTLCVESIKKQVAANHFRGKDGKDYFPHPATWLNQKRWEDEVKTTTTNKPQIKIYE